MRVIAFGNDERTGGKNMYQLLKQEGNARRGVFHTVHGDVQMPAFMNVGPAAAIQGGISS